MEYLQEPSGKNTAEQCREMGIAVGEVIEGRETYSDGKWNEARLELLWLGNEVAVFRERSRSWKSEEWTEPHEESCWTLDCRQWRKVTPNAKISPPRDAG